MNQPDTKETINEECKNEVHSQYAEEINKFDADQDNDLGPSPIYNACSDIRQCLKEYKNGNYFLPSNDSVHDIMTATSDLYCDQIPPRYPFQEYVNIPKSFETPVFTNPSYGVFQYDEKVNSPILGKSIFEISLSSDYENNHSFRKKRSTSSNSSGFWSNRDDGSPTFKETDL